MVVIFFLSEHTWKLCRLKFTLHLTLQGKAKNIFSSRGCDLCTPASQQPLAVTLAHFKACFRMPHSKSRASSEKTGASFNCCWVFFLFLPFFLQAASHAQGIDRSSDGSSSKACKSTAFNGDGATSLPSRSDEETGAQDRPRIFHYHSIDHRREGWRQYSYN